MIKEVEPLDKVEVYILRNFVLVAEVLDPLDSRLLELFDFNCLLPKSIFSGEKKLTEDLERESKVKDYSGQTKYLRKSRL